ncbi:hypothetical protein GX408_11345 [bacterium]|nr:hypothetical protein [bacterium]
MKRICICSLLGLLWLAAAPGCGQERLRLVNAALLSGWMENGENVRSLSGDVFFRQDSAEIHCDRALQYVERAQVELTGKVLLLDPPRRLTAGRVWYDEVTRDYRAYLEPQLQDTSRTLIADTLHYCERLDQATATGRIAIEEKHHRVRLQGKRAEYRRAEGYARVLGQPVLTEMDSLGAVLMTVTADTMELFEDGRRYQLAGQVHIHRDSIDAYCGRLIYVRASQKLQLIDHPWATRGQDLMRGQEMEILLEKERVVGLHLQMQTAVLSRVDSTQSRSEQYDLLTGERMEIAFRDDKISRVVVRGQATSYYHVYEDTTAKGMNKALGDEIHLYFKDGALERVRVISSPGNSSGVFYPPKQAAALRSELEEKLGQVRSLRVMMNEK